MPDGFKGMIVATSREACLRYHEALRVARDELVAEARSAGLGNHDPDGLVAAELARPVPRRG